MPEMPPAPIPNVTIVCSADNVAPACGPTDVDTPANVDTPADVGAPADVPISTATFRVRRHHDCEAERGNDGHHDGNFLQHFALSLKGDGFFRKLEIHVIVLSNELYELSLNENVHFAGIRKTNHRPKLGRHGYLWRCCVGSHT
jgi:hypothetical protein